MRIGTSPTSTTRPFLRQASKALLRSPASPPAAVTITASAPRPSVRSRTPATKSRSATVKPCTRPSACARATRSGRTSTPMTTAPAARSICAVIWPRSPRPRTATRSPSPGSARRTPWRAIAPEGREGRLLERDGVRDPGDQVPRHDVHGGVVRVAGARAGHAVADVEVDDTLADVRHDPGARVAARHLGRDPRLHQLGGALEPVARDAVHDLHHERRVADRLQDQVLAAAAAADRGRLGPRADEGVARAHQHRAGPHHRLGHLHHSDLAAAHGYLQHSVLPGVGRSLRREGKQAETKPERRYSATTVGPGPCAAHALR